MVFHVLNRGVARMQLFEKAADYQGVEIRCQFTILAQKDEPTLDYGTDTRLRQPTPDYA
jgi:hypothetical protein